MSQLGALRALLASRPPQPLPLDLAGRPAAVLVPFVQRSDGELDLLLLRRPDSMRSHAGQVAFPGGAQDEQDGSAVAAALREAEEELGLEPARVELLGELDQVYTVSHFRVSPVVGYLAQRPRLAPSAREVAAVLEVPFSLFLGEETMELRDLPGHPGVIFYRWQETEIWGATARILKRLVDLLRAG